MDNDESLFEYDFQCLVNLWEKESEWDAYCFVRISLFKMMIQTRFFTLLFRQAASRRRLSNQGYHLSQRSTPRLGQRFHNYVRRYSASP